jgi:hypothetical protein
VVQTFLPKLHRPHVSVSVEDNERIAVFEDQRAIVRGRRRGPDVMRVVLPGVRVSPDVDG